jgi:hypothetical protein
VLDLDDAEGQGLVDVMDLGPATLVVVDDDRKATLRVPISNGSFTYTPLSGSSRGAVSTYGPVSGTLELVQGAPGAAPAVSLNGKPLAPNAGPPGPPAPGSGAAPGGSPGPPASPAAPKRFKLLGRPRVRGRVIAVKLRLPGRGSVALRATAKVRKRTRTLGSLRKPIRAAETRTLRLKLKRRPPSKLRLAISFTPTGGAKQTRRVTVRRR